jgi:hypothetical protein
LDKSVVLTDVKIAGRGGTLLDCYDLFVGQRIDVLGKPTTLLQGMICKAVVAQMPSDALSANFETLEWLEFHAEKSLQKARALEIEIAKFKTSIASVTDLAKKRSNGRGTLNLRWISSKIELLKKELHQVSALLCTASLLFAAPSSLHASPRCFLISHGSTSRQEHHRQTRWVVTTVEG